MKAFFFLFASLLLAVSLATHVPGNANIGGERALAEQEQFGGGDMGDDDTEDAGDNGGMGDLGGLGGGLGGGGGGGYRALRGLGGELVGDGADVTVDKEAVVAGGRVVSGGVVVTRPRRGRFY